jgi:hypothetical protein
MVRAGLALVAREAASEWSRGDASDMDRQNGEDTPIFSMLPHPRLCQMGLGPSPGQTGKT